MKTAEVGVERLRSCLALVEIADSQAVKVMVEAIIALVSCADEMTGRQAGAAPGYCVKEAERLERAQAKIIDLWDERCKKGDG